MIAAHAIIVDGGDHVGVADVVGPGDVLVADAFDAVVAEPQWRRVGHCGASLARTSNCGGFRRRRWRRWRRYRSKTCG